MEPNPEALADERAGAAQPTGRTPANLHGYDCSAEVLAIHHRDLGGAGQAHARTVAIWLQPSEHRYVMGVHVVTSLSADRGSHPTASLGEPRPADGADDVERLAGAAVNETLCPLLELPF